MTLDQALAVVAAYGGLVYPTEEQRRCLTIARRAIREGAERAIKEEASKVFDKQDDSNGGGS